MRKFAIALATLVLLTGCGEKTLNASQITSSIDEQFAKQGAKLHDISCPDDVVAKEGTKFTCTAVNPSGTKLTLSGTVGAVSGDKAQFAVVATGGVAKGDVIAKGALPAAEQQLGQKAAGLTCPDEVKIPTSPSVTCELKTQDGSTFKTTISIDDKGNQDVKVLNQGG